MKSTIEEVEKAGLRDGLKVIIGGGQMDDPVRKYTGCRCLRRRRHGGGRLRERDGGGGLAASTTRMGGNLRFGEAMKHLLGGRP